MTKYVGGHSDLLAGALVGTAGAVNGSRLLRGTLGNQLDAHSCWLLARSMETLPLRMRASADGARAAAAFLAGHPAVLTVHALGPAASSGRGAELYRAQCAGPGSTFSVELRGGQAAAFRFLDGLRLFRLAVSLGGTDSLACHPATTTHSGVPPETRERVGVTDGLVRLSVGIEHPDDLVADLRQALAAA